MNAIVVWFCGLPGSGKTTIARGIFAKVRKNNGQLTLIQMDSIRRKLFPSSSYSDEERDLVYRSLVLIGSSLSYAGVPVFLDGTGHKKVWRDLARKECPKFVEVYVKCPIEVCIERETAREMGGDGIRQKLYQDALERLRTGKKVEGLGKVPGVDEPFEESPSPEVVIDSSKDPPDLLVNDAINQLSKYDPELFYIESRN